MKSKTSAKAGKNKKGGRLKKSKGYSVVYLAILLAATLLMEGYLLGVATTQDINAGLEILDLSKGINMVMQDVSIVVGPLMEQYDNINQFYQLAATEVIYLLDNKEADVLAFPKGMIEFYKLASVELESMLDLSDNLAFIPRVAGAAIDR